MEQKLLGLAVATLEGVQFSMLVADRAVKCRIPPETLHFLRDHILPGRTDSPIGLFKRLLDAVITIANWKQAQGLTETDGSLQLTIDDAKRALNLCP